MKKIRIDLRKGSHLQNRNISTQTKWDDRFFHQIYEKITREKDHIQIKTFSCLSQNMAV